LNGPFVSVLNVGEAAGLTTADTCSQSEEIRVPDMINANKIFVGEYERRPIAKTQLIFRGVLRQKGVGLTKLTQDTILWWASAKYNEPTGFKH
jgi:hypothetical protein